MTVRKTWAQDSVGGETSDIDTCVALASPIAIDVTGGSRLLLQKYNCPF